MASAVLLSSCSSIIDSGYIGYKKNEIKYGKGVTKQFQQAVNNSNIEWLEEIILFGFVGMSNGGKMRKLMGIILAMSVICFSACEYKYEYDAAHEMAINSTNILLNAFKTGETEELKNLFCDAIKSTHDLDKEILSAIEFMGGNITNDGDYSQGMNISAQSIRDGITPNCLFLLE